MKRRFVNLVTQNWTEGVYSVRRIDPYHHFFYGSADAALRAAAAAKKTDDPFPAMRIQDLPTPCMNFSTEATAGGTLDMFALLSPRAGDGRMVYADTMGNAGLYDAGRHVHTALDRLNERKQPRPMCLSIAHPYDADEEEDGLYVLDRHPGKGNHGCFEVLERTPTRFRISSMPQWHWRPLPPPPFQSSYITSFTTMVDGDGCSTIYVSCGGGVGVGTYSYETPRHDYHKPRGWHHVGEWMLPFNGRAQYAPEFSLWFGFSASSPDDHLCATDLSASISMDGGRQPRAPTVWEDLNPPEGEVWRPNQLELVHLGGGKFLVAKKFEAGEIGPRFAVLTGIEMMAGAGGGDRQQALQMVKHKCARFFFRDEEIEWVL